MFYCKCPLRNGYNHKLKLRVLNESIVVYVYSQWGKSAFSKETLAVLALRLFDIGGLPKMH